MTSIHIVEDDANICEIETIVLRNSGYEVAAFENAKEFYWASDKNYVQHHL